MLLTCFCTHPSLPTNMTEPKIQEIECDEPSASASAPVSAPVADAVAHTKNLVPLVQKWIEIGTNKGCFSIDVAYALFISLQLLNAEPHTAIVGNGKVLHDRVQSVANLMIACKSIQAKGRIFTSVEQGAQVYETIQMLNNIVNQEVKAAGQDDQSHRHCSEQDLIPQALRLAPQLTVEKLVAQLELLTRKGFEMGAIDFEKNQALSVALMLLKRNPGDTIMNAEKTTQIMNRLDAFKILAEAISDITIKGDLMSLADVVVIWPSIILLKKHFEEEIQGGGKSGEQDGDATASAASSSTTNNHKKRKTDENECQE